jgi:hypothetical protein
MRLEHPIDNLPAKVELRCGWKATVLHAVPGEPCRYVGTTDHDGIPRAWGPDGSWRMDSIDHELDIVAVLPAEGLTAKPGKPWDKGWIESAQATLGHAAHRDTPSNEKS